MVSLRALDIKVTPKDTRGLPVHNAAANFEQVTWYPGVTVFGQYMMEHLKFACISDRKGNSKIWPQEILSRAPKGDREPNLICLAFQSNSHVAHTQQPSAWDGVDDKIKDDLDRLFSDSGTYEITLWFVGKGLPMGMEFIPNCLNYFIRAYRQRLPPLHQYMDVNGTPMLDIEKVEPILTFRDGMYCKWPKDQVSGAINKSKGPISFHKLEQKMNWQMISEFHIYQSMQTIRAMQFQKGKMVHVQVQLHHIFLKSVPSMAMDNDTKFAVAKSELSSDQRHLRFNCVYAYVRQTPNKSGLREESPAEGSHIKMDWDNSTALRGHAPSHDWDKWQGDVVSVPPSELLATGTDFCVFLTKPGSETRTIKQYPKLRKLRNEHLPKAFIEVTYDNGPAVRELIAVREFSDVSTPNRVLDPFRQAFVSKPAPQAETIDLSCGVPPTALNKQAYRGYIKSFRSQLQNNQKQLEVLQAVTMVRDRVSLVIGPPGTGKTKILVIQAQGLMAVGHKPLFTAKSNITVDTIAASFWKSRPSYLSDKKFLRLETTAAERKNILRSQDYLASDLDADQTHTTISAEESDTYQKDPEYIYWFNKAMEAVVDFASGQEVFDRIYRNVKGHSPRRESEPPQC